MNSTDGYYFKSSLFEAEIGEDEETNPRMYGRQLARWLRQRLLSLGYRVEDVFGEDWGWCVMCQREPYCLFIGCRNLIDIELARPEDPPPAAEQLLWHAVPMAERSFLKYLFRSKPELMPGLRKLDEELRGILDAEPRIEIVSKSVADDWFKQFS